MIKEFLKKLSLKQRLRIIMLIPACTLFLVTIYIYISDRQRDYISYIESEAQTLALGMSSILESSLLSSDKDGIEKILKSTLDKANCHQLTVYNVDKTVFSTVGKELKSETISQIIPIYTESFTDPFENAGIDNNTTRKSEVIGYLEVKVGNISFAKKHSNEILLAIIILLSVLLIALILTEILGNYIVKNIKRVIDLSIENYQSGEFNKEYVSDDKSELGELFENKERERVLVKETLERQTKLRLKADAAYLAKTRLLQVISHELNTPLSSAYGMLQLANKRTEKYFKRKVNSEEKVLDDSLREFSQLRHYLTVGEKSIEHLSRFFSDLLAISDEEIFAAKIQKINILYLIKNIVENHKLDAKSKSLSFKVNLNIHPEVIYTDDLRVSQIFNNLLSNAIKYTEEGEVMLSVSNYKDVLKISVRDTGCGISEEDRKNIFKLSKRTSFAIDNYPGEGLGLYVVGKCVETLKGEVSISSTVNDFTEFEVSIPLSNKCLEPEAEITLRETGLDIIVIDDDEDNLYTISEILKLFDVSIKTFRSPYEAFDAITTNKPDITIVDYQMHGMNGAEFIHKTKKYFSNKNSTPPLFICCSASGDSIKAELESVGVDGFISKPFTIQKIISVINGFYIGKNYLSNS